MPSSSRTYHSPPQYAYPQQSDPNISATAVLSCAFAGVFVIYYILSGILALPSLTDIVVLMAGLLFGPAAREYLQSTFATSPRQVVSQVRNRAASIVGRSATLSHSGGTVGGLWNVGNTCYQNSVLQALASLDSLKPWLVSIEDGTAAAALARLVADLNLIKDKPRAATADTLITQESGGTRGWMFNEQQDAQEFLQGLMGVLEKEVSREMDKRKKENTIGLEGILGGRKKNSTVSPLDANLRSPFEGLLAQRVGCLRCGYVESISLQPFTTLSLPIPSTWATTLEDCLRVFTSIENIPEVDCDKCTLQAVRQRLQNILDSPPPPGFENLFSDISDVNYPAFKDTLTVRLDAVSAALEEDNFTARIPGVRLDGVHKVSSTKTKQVMVARAPQVLVLHTNRSQFDILTGMVGKNYAAVRFPALLDLGELDVVTRHEMLSVNPGNPISSVHLLGDDSATAIIDNVVYYLKAVVAHYGGHHNGHYVAYRSWAGKWWRISDHEVIPCAEEDALAAGNAFMLFYERMSPNDIREYHQISPPREALATALPDSPLLEALPGSPPVEPLSNLQLPTPPESDDGILQVGVETKQVDWKEDDFPTGGTGDEYPDFAGVPDLTPDTSVSSRDPSPETLTTSANSGSKSKAKGKIEVGGSSGNSGGRRKGRRKGR